MCHSVVWCSQGSHWPQNPYEKRPVAAPPAVEHHYCNLTVKHHHYTEITQILLLHKHVFLLLITALYSKTEERRTASFQRERENWLEVKKVIFSVNNSHGFWKSYAVRIRYFHKKNLTQQIGIYFIKSSKRQSVNRYFHCVKNVLMITLLWMWFLTKHCKHSTCVE